MTVHGKRLYMVTAHKIVLLLFYQGRLDVGRQEQAQEMELVFQQFELVFAFPYCPLKIR